MADVKVKLKDASGNVLHPETEWSLVQGRPSFTIGQNSSGQRSETWSAPIISVVGENLIGLVSPRGGIMINDSVVGKNTPLADYPIKPKGVLKSKNMKVQELVNDKNLIDKIVKIERLEFGVGGYIKDRFACNWLWSSGNSGTQNDYILYYINASGNNTKLNNSDSILVTYLDLPITWENMPIVNG